MSTTNAFKVVDFSQIESILLRFFDEIMICKAVMPGCIHDRRAHESLGVLIISSCCNNFFECYFYILVLLGYTKVLLRSDAEFTTASGVLA